MSNRQELKEIRGYKDFGYFLTHTLREKWQNTTIEKWQNWEKVVPRPKCNHVEKVTFVKLDDRISWKSARLVLNQDKICLEKIQDLFWKNTRLVLKKYKTCLESGQLFSNLRTLQEKLTKKCKSCSESGQDLSWKNTRLVLKKYKTCLESGQNFTKCKLYITVSIVHDI